MLGRRGCPNCMRVLCWGIQKGGWGGWGGVWTFMFISVTYDVSWGRGVGRWGEVLTFMFSSVTHVSWWLSVGNGLGGSFLSSAQARYGGWSTWPSRDCRSSSRHRQEGHLIQAHCWIRRIAAACKHLKVPAATARHSLSEFTHVQEMDKRKISAQALAALKKGVGKKWVCLKMLGIFPMK